MAELGQLVQQVDLTLVYLVQQLAELAQLVETT
jgi:hypothetical protein